MVLTCCVRERKNTECVEPSGYKTAKNGRQMFWCTCASCGIRKFKFLKTEKKKQKKTDRALTSWGRFT